MELSAHLIGKNITQVDRTCAALFKDNSNYAEKDIKNKEIDTNDNYKGKRCRILACFLGRFCLNLSSFLSSVISTVDLQLSRTYLAPANAGR